MKGTVQVLDIPDDAELKTMTEQVIANNFNFRKASSVDFDWRKNNPVPLYPGEKESPIKHIVFISKENRTYDEVFGQVEKGNGDAGLARYGKAASFYNWKRTDSLKNVDVMVNLLKIAGDFAMSDNFYWDRTSKQYPTYNTAIPDQFRIDQFKKEFEAKWMNGQDTMPAFMTVIIPNDHGAGDRPEAGYPFRESYMADNDLAVGRIIEYLSHTPYWKNMLIVITEDDAQNGVDHVDAHRSVLMLISPWVKRDYVSHVHYSFGSIFKTFWNILGLPYLNQYDAGANDMADFFTAEPGFTTYRAVQVDSRIFEPQKALDPFDENFDWKALEESPVMDDKEDMIRESKERDEFRLGNREKEDSQ